VQREHRVVLNSRFPDDVGILVPLLEGLQDPTVLGVSPSDPSWISASCLPQFDQFRVLQGSLEQLLAGVVRAKHQH
jgi:hypothetical protein